MFENRALSPAQVASRLQVREERVLRWLGAGELRGLTSGDRWFTSAQSVATFLEARANRPSSGRPAAGRNGRLYAFTRRGRASG